MPFPELDGRSTPLDILRLVLSDALDGGVVLRVLGVCHTLLSCFLADHGDRIYAHGRSICDVSVSASTPGLLLVMHLSPCVTLWPQVLWPDGHGGARLPLEL